MKIIITGATGFVGANLIRHLHSKGHEIIALGKSDKIPAALKQLAEYIRMDLNETSQRESILADVCIHAAALTSTKASYADMLQTNLHGTEKLLKVVKCHHFIYISSSSVYAPGLNILESQTNLQNNALSAYGKTKLLSERLLADNYYNKNGSLENLTILRPRAIYGKGDRLLLPKLLKLLKGYTLLWPGNKNVVSSMTHIDNICNLCEVMLHKKNAGLETFNICDHKDYNLYDTVKTLLETIRNKPFETFFLPASPLLPFIKLLHGNNNLTFELMQLNTSMTLDANKLQAHAGFVPETLFSAAEIADWYNGSGIAGYDKHLWPWID